MPYYNTSVAVNRNNELATWPYQYRLSYIASHRAHTLYAIYIFMYIIQVLKYQQEQYKEWASINQWCECKLH